jgi:nitroimidazol reductase NimA-like FMN-containing flavoprotein (pyridoxamine 5'-phosphate oxidase superfamily)
MCPVKLPKMSHEEVQQLLGDQFICRIAFNGGEYPYLAPFRYIMIDGVLYFHFTDYGKKMDLLEQNNRVCVQIESYLPDLSDYNFVSLRGRLVKVTDPMEYKQAVGVFSETGSNAISTNFLAAHGFNPADGWKALTGEDLVIMKLVDIVERVGLKSPD